MAQVTFDATQTAPSTGAPEAVPADWYKVVMTDSEMKPTKDSAQTGNAYLNCTLSIIEGPYTNSKIFCRLNLKNINPVAQTIAYEELSAICHAVNVMSITQTEMLHNIPFQVKVKYRAAEGSYEASNEVTKYKNINEVVNHTSAPAQAATSTPAQPAAQPWQQQQAPAQQPAQQPVQQAPAQAPAQTWQQPAQQPAAQPAQQAPAQQAPAQTWQQPAAAQPWQQPAEQPAQQPVQQPVQQAPAQQPVQQAPAQQPVQQAPAQQAPAQAGLPPWGQAK